MVGKVGIWFREGVMVVVLVDRLMEIGGKSGVKYAKGILVEWLVFPRGGGHGDLVVGGKIVRVGLVGVWFGCSFPAVL